MAAQTRLLVSFQTLGVLSHGQDFRIAQWVFEFETVRTAIRADVAARDDAETVDAINLQDRSCASSQRFLEADVSACTLQVDEDAARCSVKGQQSCRDRQTQTRRMATTHDLFGVVVD